MWEKSHYAGRECNGAKRPSPVSQRIAHHGLGRGLWEGEDALQVDDLYHGRVHSRSAEGAA
jgi:hypothetical protein